MENKEKLARLLLASAEVPDKNTPPVPAGLAQRAASLAVDVPVVRRILTSSYTVRPSLETGAIRCTSRTGMRLPGDNDNDAMWEQAMSAFRRHFGPRLLEVDFNTCAFYSDFTIYLKASESATIEKTPKP
jgi:hypothetical protein